MACSIVFYNKFKYNFENALKMCDEKILQCRSIEIIYNVSNIDYLQYI
ncbi:hypothetical protein BpHYR1_050538 [Brachionus plicatilis]|uniref:Uncharacterized protein n=1 Tax=Brachionus plicatilis TaxID=10195 RepID=A0A3M7SP61_BRAPC|nr:hypothetical protein BpHYR1_050538 [Brachionus plicatilis]